MPSPGALVTVTLVHRTFDYKGLRAQWSSHCVAYQLFGQATTRVRDHFAGERVFFLEPERVYHLPLGVFTRAWLSFAPVTTLSLTLLLTVFNPVTLQRVMRKVVGPVCGSLRKLKVALSSLQDLEQSSDLGPAPSIEMPASFDLLTLNVEHTVKTKVVALRRVL